jgi:DNA-binding IclR family transcriptional regulator
MLQADSTKRFLTHDFDILSCFNARLPRLAATEISKMVEFPKRITRRLLQSLKIHGFMNYEGKNPAFQWEDQLICRGDDAQPGADVQKIAWLYRKELSDGSGEASVHSIRNGYSGFCLDMCESAHPMRLSMRVGQPLELYTGLLAKIFGAFLPDDEILQHIKPIPLMDHTISNEKQMIEELHNIRERGYTSSSKETESLSVPINNCRMKLDAGKGVIAPVSSVTEDVEARMVKKVVRTATLISNFYVLL